VGVIAATVAVLYENRLLTPSNLTPSSTPGHLAHSANDFTVADGKIFAADGWGDVFCFDAQSGISIWNASVGSYLATGPTITTYQGRVYVGIRGGVVTSLDEDTGKVQLQFTAPLLSDIDIKTPPSFTVAYGMVIVSSESGTNAYNASTGALLWNSTVGGALFWVYPYPQLFVPFDGGLFCIPTLTSVNLNNGSALWTIPGSSDGPPVFSQDRIVLWNYYNLRQTLLCVNASSGVTLWSFDVGTPMFQPTVSNGLLLFGAEDGYFYAINLADGNLKWKKLVDDENLIATFNNYSQEQQVFLHMSTSLVQVDPQNQRVFWSVIVSYNGQDIYNGTIWSLDLSNGNRIWTLPVTDNRPIDTSIYANYVSMTLSNHTLYVTEHTDLYCLDEYTGSIQLMQNFDHYILPPAVSNGMVFVVADGDIITYR
jgi:outer membrane protein assembly factor BamB